MNKYFYIIRWEEGELYLDSFYKVRTDASTKEEQLLEEAVDPKTKHDFYRDKQAIEALTIRARYNGLKVKLIKCEEELTYEQWEKFLQTEYKRNPNSRWIK
jgi:hypothetical protein